MNLSQLVDKVNFFLSFFLFCQNALNLTLSLRKHVEFPVILCLNFLNLTPSGRRADAERAEQEQQLLCGVDPQQRQDSRLRHSTPRLEDVRHLHRQLHRHPGALQACLRAVYSHVPS